jgi:hypothetical protein
MRFSFLVLLGSAAVGAAACGGKVVVDGTGDKLGGVGGTASSSSGDATSGSPSSGSGVDDPTCLTLCTAVLATGCAGNDCIARCASAFAGNPSCLDAAKAAASCVIANAANAPGCTVHACDDALTAYAACTSAPTCEKSLFGATGTTPGCVGKGICAGNDEWAATCDETGLCECDTNAGTVGTCQETGPFLCDYFRGCCAAFFPLGK